MSNEGTEEQGHEGQERGQEVSHEKTHEGQEQVQLTDQQVGYICCMTTDRSLI